MEHHPSPKGRWTNTDQTAYVNQRKRNRASTTNLGVPGNDAPRITRAKRRRKGRRTS